MFSVAFSKSDRQSNARSVGRASQGAKFPAPTEQCCVPHAATPKCVCGISFLPSFFLWASCVKEKSGLKAKIHGTGIRPLTCGGARRGNFLKKVSTPSKTFISFHVYIINSITANLNPDVRKVLLRRKFSRPHVQYQAAKRLVVGSYSVMGLAKRNGVALLLLFMDGTGI